MENKNRGVKILPRKEGAASVPFKENVPTGDHTPYLPIPEDQFDSNGDFMDCETEAFVHSLETQMNFLKATDAFSVDQITQMTALGYINTNGSFQFSVRFLAKMDGTTDEGNDNENVMNGFKEYGIVAQNVWPWDTTMTFAEYYAEIPQNIIDQGKEIFKFIQVNGFQWLIEDEDNTLAGKALIIKNALKQAPVQISVPLCPTYYTDAGSNDIITSCGETTPVHSMMIFSENNSYEVRDDYNPYNKAFALDYPMLYASQTIIEAVADVTSVLSHSTASESLSLPHPLTNVPLIPNTPVSNGSSEWMKVCEHLLYMATGKTLKEMKDIISKL